MMTITRDQVDSALGIAGIDGDAYRPGYSGRGMYGGTCPAIVADIGNVFAFIAALSGILTVDWDAETDPVELAHATKIDQMGPQVVAYWPQMQVVG